MWEPTASVMDLPDNCRESETVIPILCQENVCVVHSAALKKEYCKIQQARLDCR